MPKLKTQFTERTVKKGTVISEPSKTDLTQQQDSDIYAMFEKYGVAGIVPQTKAGNYMFIDEIHDPLMNLSKMTLDETLRFESQVEDYYASLPSKVRKVFGDNKREFMHRYKNRDFDDFLNYGILNQEQVNILNDKKEIKVKNEEKTVSESNN